MLPVVQQLFNFIFNKDQAIIQAIQSGAGWEVWLQVEMFLEFKANNYNAARETPYDTNNPNSQKLDLLAADAQGHHLAIELKVESATNAGNSVLNGAISDKNKLAQYQIHGVASLTKCVIALAYSAQAMNALSQYANNPANSAHYNSQNGLGCLIITA